MKSSTRNFAIGFGSLLLAGVATTALAADDKKSSPEQVAQVETIIRDLLAREPALIENALRASMQKKEQEAKEHSLKMVKKHQDEIFGNKNDPYLGNPKATVTLAVFMDPYCGHCRHLQQNLKEVMATRNDFKVIYKAFPILSKESQLAAEEELAANRLGQFSNYHTALYASDADNRAARLELAGKEKIDVTKMKEYLEGKDNKKAQEIDKELEANRQLGQKLGINGTPAIVAGDTLISGAMSKEQINQLLDEMKKQGTKS